MYRGSLPDFISRLSPDFDPIDLQELCDRYNSKTDGILVRFILGRVVDIDIENNLICVQNKNEGNASPGSSDASIRYDVLSIDIGSKSKSLDEVPGANLYTIPTRPVYNMIESLKQADEQLQTMADKFARQKSGKYDSNTDENDKPKPVRVSVVGGGANGIELALACRSRWKTILKDHELWISLISKESMLLPEVPYARRKLTETLINNDVYLHMKSAVTKVEKDRLILTNGDAPPVPFDHCLWATGAGCHNLPRVLEKHGLSVTNQGWIKIHSTLQSVSHSNVFACGDCASLPNPLPKSGVYGLQEGPVLAKNLDRYAQGKPLVTYEPNTEDLQFLSLGDGTAMGFAFGLVLRGEWVFEVKQAMNRHHYLSLTGHEKPASAANMSPDDSSKSYSYRLNSKVLKEVEGVSAHDAAGMLMEINIENYQEAWAILERMSVDKIFRSDVMKQYNNLSDSCGKRRHIEERVDHEKSTPEQEKPTTREINDDTSSNNNQSVQSTGFPPLNFFSWLLKRSWKDNSLVNSTHTD